MGPFNRTSDGPLPARPVDLQQLVQQLETAGRDAQSQVAKVCLHPFDYLRLPWHRARNATEESAARVRFVGVQVIADRQVPIGTLREYDSLGALLREAKIGPDETTWLRMAAGA